MKQYMGEFKILAATVYVFHVDCRTCVLEFGPDALTAFGRELGRYSGNRHNFVFLSVAIMCLQLSH